MAAAGEEGPGKHQQGQDFRPKRLATQVLCCDVRALGSFYLSGSFRYGRDRDEKLPGPDKCLDHGSPVTVLIVNMMGLRAARKASP